MTIPRKPIFGDRIDPSLVGARQVPSIPAAKNAMPPISVAKLFRNGKHPSADGMNQIMEATNQAALFRTRQLFWCPGVFGANPLASTASSRARYRFAFRTSPYAHALYAIVPMAQQTSGKDQNSYSRLTIYSDDNEAVTVKTCDFYYGANPLGNSSAKAGWQYVKAISGYIDGLTPDTDYYATFSDESYGRIMSATVIELNSMTENFSGYLPQNLTSQTEMLDVYRERAALLQRNLWKRCGAHVLNWTRNDGTTSRSITSATSTNLLDGTSTTYGSSIPGYTLDMRNKARISQTSGIPVVMKVFANTNDAGGAGRVVLRNSAGSAVLTVSGGFYTGSYRWQSVSGFLPATQDKYYLTFDSTSAAIQFRVRAVSIYEYET